MRPFITPHQQVQEADNLDINITLVNPFCDTLDALDAFDTHDVHRAQVQRILLNRRVSEVKRFATGLSDHTYNSVSRTRRNPALLLTVVQIGHRGHEIFSRFRISLHNLNANRHVFHEITSRKDITLRPDTRHDRSIRITFSLRKFRHLPRYRKLVPHGRVTTQVHQNMRIRQFNTVRHFRSQHNIRDTNFTRRVNRVVLRAKNPRTINAYHRDIARQASGHAS